MKRFVCTVALLLTLSLVASAQENDTGRPLGPPPEVVAAWKSGFSDILPGPPPEVIEAWENGEGEDLPGPPQFVRDILAMFGRVR